MFWLAVIAWAELYSIFDTCYTLAAGVFQCGL